MYLQDSTFGALSHRIRPRENGRGNASRASRVHQLLDTRRAFVASFRHPRPRVDNALNVRNEKLCKPRPGLLGSENYMGEVFHPTLGKDLENL